MEGEVMEGGWSGDDDDDGDDLPSPKANSASRLALPKKNRGWRRLRDGKLRKELLIWGFRVVSKNTRQSRAPGGVGPTQATPRRGPGGARPQGAWAPPGPPSGPWFLRVRGFSVIFRGFF